MARKKIEAQGNANESTPAKQSAAPIRRSRRMTRGTSVEEPCTPETENPDLNSDTTANSDAAKGSEPSEPTTAVSPPRGQASKIGQVVGLLERAEGATLAEMVEATGWQPHSTRAALTGLKKKGRTITKDKRGEVTCYHLAASA